MPAQYAYTLIVAHSRCRRKGVAGQSWWQHSLQVVWLQEEFCLKSTKRQRTCQIHNHNLATQDVSNRISGHRL